MSSSSSAGANTAHLQGAALRYGASHQLPANLPHSSQCHCRHHYAAEEERDGPEGDEREERILSNEASCSFSAHEAKLEPASLCCSVHPGKRSNTSCRGASRRRSLFGRLGSAPADKRHIVFDAGHLPPNDLFTKEVLDWLDRHLGPVG